MNYRRAVMLPEKAVTSGTETLDFKIKDVISQLQIQMRLVNGDSVPDGHPAFAVKKIDIVDGSDVLWSLSGEQAHALDFYQTGKEPPDILSFVSANKCSAILNINFGRWLWDSDLAFDPTRFNNPQLKIQYDYALGGSSTNAATLGVYARCFNDLKPTPMGWLMAKEYYNYTLVAAAYQNVEMPTDYVMRQLLLASRYAGKAPWENMGEVKLSEENDKQVLFDGELLTLQKEITSDYKWYKERIRVAQTGTTVTHYCTPALLTGYAGNTISEEAYAATFLAGYGGTFGIKGTGAGVVDVQIHGQQPHGVVAIPFGWLDTIEAWYDVTKLGSLNLRIKAGASAVGTCQVITEQLRRY